MGFVDDRASDGDALTLAAGKLVRQMRGALGKTDSLQRDLGPAPALAAAEPGAEHRHLDILARRQRGKQVELLKHDADLRAPEIGPGLRIADGVPFQSTRPALGRRMPQRRRISRLAAPARPDNGDRVALVDGEAYLLERDDAPIVETMADMIEGNQGFRGDGMIGH